LPKRVQQGIFLKRCAGKEPTTYSLDSDLKGGLGVIGFAVDKRNKDSVAVGLEDCFLI
jgi:hypothetical protein